MTVWNAEAVAAFAARGGFTGDNLVIAVAVALGTSNAGGETANDAYRAVGSYGQTIDERGLWGIDVEAHPELVGLDLFDPTVNAQVALRVWEKEVDGWAAWTAYRFGLVEGHLVAAEAAVTDLRRDGPAVAIARGVVQPPASNGSDLDLGTLYGEGAAGPDGPAAVRGTIY